MKKTTQNLIMLNLIFCIGLIMSNLVGGKILNVFGLTVAGAIATYPLTFLMTDIIGELWGKEEANRTVKLGMICQVIFLVLGFITLKLPYNVISEDFQQSLTMVLNQGLRMTLASFGAFSISQFLDVAIFHKLKDVCKGKHKWLRNNAGTMISQLVDTAIFITIAFWGVVPNLFGMVIAQYIVKFVLALADTPFFYFFTRKNKESN